MRAVIFWYDSDLSETDRVDLGNHRNDFVPRFVKECAKEVRAKGGQTSNVDTQRIHQRIRSRLKDRLSPQASARLTEEPRSN